MNSTVATMEIANRVATWRSARRAAIGSVSPSRWWCTGRPGFWNRAGSEPSAPCSPARTTS